MSINFKLSQNLNAFAKTLLSQLAFLKCQYDFEIKTDVNGNIIRIGFQSTLGDWFFEQRNVGDLKKEPHDSFYHEDFLITGMFLAKNYDHRQFRNDSLPKVIRDIKNSDIYDVNGYPSEFIDDTSYDKVSYNKAVEKAKQKYGEKPNRQQINEFQYAVQIKSLRNFFELDEKIPVMLQS